MASLERRRLVLAREGDPSPAWRGGAAATVRAERWRPESPEGFNVVVVEPHLPTEVTAIYPMSYDYRIEPFVARRLQVLAATTGWRWVGVDLPGVTMDLSTPSATTTSRVPPGALRAAVRGDFSGLAALQATAIRETLGSEIGRVRLVGESLGAQLVASMRAGGLFDGPVDLIEPVNPIRIGFGRLAVVAARLAGIESRRRDEAFAENASSGWGDLRAFEHMSDVNARTDRRLKRWSRQGRFAVLTALGLRKGIDATLASSMTDLDLTIWRSRDSTVSRSEGCVELARRTRERGGHAELIELTAPPGEGAIGHHILVSLARLATFGRALAEGPAGDRTAISD